MNINDYKKMTKAELLKKRDEEFKNSQAARRNRNGGAYHEAFDEIDKIDAVYDAKDERHDR